MFLELGWEPLSAFIDRQRVSYFKRLIELPDQRLCKQVFNEMIVSNEKVWKYEELIHGTLDAITPNLATNDIKSIDNLNSLIGSWTRNKQMTEIHTKSSLDVYKHFYIGIGRQHYLNGNDFQASRLKLLARTKTIPLKEYYAE